MLVLALLAIGAIAQRPIRQYWAVFNLQTVVANPDIDQSSPFTDVHKAVHAVDDLQAGPLATPRLARAFKASPTRRQMKILEALILLRKDIAPAIPDLVVAFSDTKARPEDRDCVAILIEYGDPQTAAECGAARYLRDRKQKNVLIRLHGGKVTP